MKTHAQSKFRVSVVLIASLVVNLVIDIRANAQSGSDLPDYMSVIAGNNVPADQIPGRPAGFRFEVGAYRRLARFTSSTSLPGSPSRILAFRISG